MKFEAEGLFCSLQIFLKIVYTVFTIREKYSLKSYWKFQWDKYFGTRSLTIT